MKKLFNSFFLIITLVFLGEDAVGQCGSKKFMDSCSVFPKEYVFSKARIVNIKTKKDLQSSIFSVILTKGNTYLITVCDGDEAKNDGRMVVNLFDNRDRLIMSSFNLESQKYYNKIIFKCNSTGTYYLGYLFDGGESKGCGISAFGFMKKK